MLVKDKLSKKLRIHIIAPASRPAFDWMEVHGFLKKGWRDPRVRILMTTEDLDGLHESADTEFVFLEGWQATRSPLFRQKLWGVLPHVMQRNRVV